MSHKYYTATGRIKKTFSYVNGLKPPTEVLSTDLKKCSISNALDRSADVLLNDTAADVTSSSGDSEEDRKIFVMPKKDLNINILYTVFVFHLHVKS